MSSAIQESGAGSVPQDNMTSISLDANKKNIAPKASNTIFSTPYKYEDSRVTALRIFMDTISEWKKLPRALGTWECEGHRFTVYSGVQYIENQHDITSKLREDKSQLEEKVDQLQKELLKAKENVTMLTVQNTFLRGAKKARVREAEHTGHKRTREDALGLLTTTPVGSDNEIGDSISGSTTGDDEHEAKRIKED